MTTTINPSTQSYIPDLPDSGQPTDVDKSKAVATVNQLSIDDTTTVPTIRAGASDPSVLLAEPLSGDKLATPTNMISALNTNSGSTGIDIYALAVVFQNAAQQIRNAQKSTQAAETQAEVASMKAGATEMRSAADSRFAAAVTQGALQIGSGALQVGMGAASFSQGMKGVNSSREADALETDAMSNMRSVNANATREEMAPEVSGTVSNLRTSGEAYGQQSQMLNTAARGTGDILSGVGTIASGALEKEAAYHDAAKQDLDADAKLHDAEAQKAADLAAKMDDVIKSMRESVSQIQQLHHDAVSSIARNMS